MIVFFVDGNAMECCDDDHICPEDFIEKFEFETEGEVEAFRKGVEAGSRYDDTEASIFFSYEEALSCCRKAIIEYHGRKKLLEEPTDD